MCTMVGGRPPLRLYEQCQVCLSTLMPRGRSRGGWDGVRDVPRDEKIRASCVPLFAFLEHLLLFGWRILLPRCLNSSSARRDITLHSVITDRQHFSLVSVPLSIPIHNMCMHMCM